MDAALSEIAKEAEKVKSLLNAKMSQWWSKTVEAGKQAIAKVDEELKKSALFNPQAAAAAAAAERAKFEEDNPVLPDMFHDFAPCPVVRGSSDIINGKNWCRIWSDLPAAGPHRQCKSRPASAACSHAPAR